MVARPLPTADGVAAPDAVPLASVLDTVLAGLGAPTVDVLLTLHERWPEVIGEDVATFSRPVAVEAGTLVVGVRSAAWAGHLRWAEAEVVARAAEVLGEGHVTSMSVRVERG